MAKFNTIEEALEDIKDGKIIVLVVEIVIQVAFSSRSICEIVPNPSTCPLTICPPKRSPRRKARSKLTS